MIKFVLQRGEFKHSSDIAEICQCSRQWVTAVRRRMRAIQDGMTVSQRSERLDENIQDLRRSIREYLSSEPACQRTPRRKSTCCCSSTTLALVSHPGSAEA